MVQCAFSRIQPDSAVRLTPAARRVPGCGLRQPELARPRRVVGSFRRGEARRPRTVELMLEFVSAVRPRPVPVIASPEPRRAAAEASWPRTNAARAHRQGMKRPSSPSRGHHPVAAHRGSGRGLLARSSHTGAHLARLQDSRSTTCAVIAECRIQLISATRRGMSIRLVYVPWDQSLDVILLTRPRFIRWQCARPRAARCPERG